MNDLRPSISYLANGFNKVKNSRIAVIYAVDSEIKVQQGIKNKKEKDMLEANKTSQTFKFDPNEIEPIILKRREIEER